MSSTDVSRWRCHVLVAVDLLNALAWNILMRSMLASGLLGIVLEHDLHTETIVPAMYS